MPATIRDVARIAGVSVTAAHRALNGKSELKSDKRERVLEAARELNYVPSAAARALVSGKTNTIGMVVTDNSSPVYAGVVRGVEEITNAAGYGLLLCNSYVLLMRHFAEIDSDYVITDNETGGYEATAHLLDLGHTRIGHVAGPACVSSAQGRMFGYHRALAECGIPFSEDLIAHAPFTIGGGYDASLRLLDRPDRPSAIFSSNDLQAVGVMKAARELNLKIPDNLALVGGDDIELAEFLEVPLTTFHQPLREIGSLGAEILIERLRGESEEKRQVVLTPQLVVRRSSGWVR
jgi:LacI family transcriptional regulator